jgi:phosphatidylinositol-3-phosphatase
MSGEHPAPCEDCGSPLAQGQNYCLECGARATAAPPALAQLLARVNGREAGAPAPATPSASTPSDPPPPPPRSWATALSLPRPSISAVLVLAFLGFGLALGNVASSPTRTSLAAAARQQLKLVLPTARSAIAAVPATAPSSSSSNAEPPEAQPESTPTSTPSKATPARPAAPKPAAEEGKGKQGGGASEAAASTPAKKLPAIKHVFVIMLSQQSYAAVFGPESAAGYLTHTLEQRGELLVHYDAVAHEQLANELALISGQGPTEETALNCATYSDITPATLAADEQIIGNGCLYPASTQTLAGQLSAKHLSWRAYIQGTDEPGLPVGACAHPALGATDPTSAPETGAYATSIDPFVYFHSIIDTPACAANDVGLGQLQADLANASTTPSFAYIAPDRCHNASPTPCTPGAPAGLGPADTFLRNTVSEITASKAYKESGLIVLTVDEAPSSGPFQDSSSCCGQPRFPNLAAASKTLTAHGGGAVGALLLSPYVKGATTSQEPFNHLSLLRTIEDLFGLGHLGYAALATVKSFEPAMFTSGRSTAK